MNRTLLQAQLMYDDMGRSEKKVADWLFSHSGEVLPYSITDLASKCESSEATIVRFSKRLGCRGYQDLKLTLAKEHEKKVVAPVITKDDDCFSIFEKVCNDAYMSLERTKKTLSAENMSRAMEAISSARRVVLIGLGTSAQVAEDASNKLLRAGCNSSAYADTHMQAIAVSQLKAGDVVIGISQSGSSKDIVESMKVARARGATTISITSKERSPIARQSDILLLTDTEETMHSTLGLNSHISRLILIDALCYKIVYQNTALASSVGNSEAELQSKRIVE
ncbi:MAG: MurR/RpiR family transcriptional regulator [Clostridia bacterium]|nr:MurR/RpiR family transcriptional regulator [Clostridia bacterium]MBR2944308.1 MurR/RpiR family transcriptional regulator [Clostridia bacterium]